MQGHLWPSQLWSEWSLPTPLWRQFVERTQDGHKIPFASASSDASYGLAADADYLRLTVGLVKKLTTGSDVLSQPRFFQHPFLEATLKGLNLLPPASFIPRWQ